MRFALVKVVTTRPIVCITEMTPSEFNTSGLARSGNRLRQVDGKSYVYREITHIDAIVLAPGENGKMRIVHREEVKTGADSPKDAQAQVDAARNAIQRAAGGGDDVRLDANGADITSSVDLASVSQSTEATRGTAGRGFKESLSVTKRDLDAVIDGLLQNALARKPGAEQ